MNHLRSSLRHLAPIGTGSGEADTDSVFELALEDALLRRALHHGWDLKRLTRAGSCLRNAPSSFSETLRSELQQPGRPHSWCTGCSDRCRFDYEGQILASDHGFLAAAFTPGDRSAEVWAIAIAEAACAAAQTLFPGAGAPPQPLIGCALGRALAGSRIKPDSVEAVMHLIMNHRKENPDE